MMKKLRKRLKIKLKFLNNKLISMSRIKRETPEKDEIKSRFFKSLGGWKDIDAESLIKKIYESRDISTRKKVEFE